MGGARAKRQEECMHSDGEALTMMRQEEVPPLLSWHRQLGRLARVLDDEDLSRRAQLEHKEAERHEQHGQREDEQSDRLAGGVDFPAQRRNSRLSLQPELAEEDGHEGQGRDECHKVVT